MICDASGTQWTFLVERIDVCIECPHIIMRISLPRMSLILLIKEIEGLIFVDVFVWNLHFRHVSFWAESQTLQVD